MTAFWTDFDIRLNVTYKTNAFPDIQASKNLSPTLSTCKKLYIEKQRDLITQNEREPHCFRKSSRLYVTWPLEEDKVLQYVGSDMSMAGSQGFSDALDLGTLWLRCQPVLHQHFGVGGRFETKPQDAFFTQAELSGELTATSRSEMPKADMGPKSFLPNSPSQKCTGVTCARRQRPPQLSPLSHVPTGCPCGGRMEALLAPAPAPRLPPWTVLSLTGFAGQPCPYVPTSGKSYCSGQFYQKHPFCQYLMYFFVCISSEPPRCGGHRFLLLFCLFISFKE